MGHLDHALIQVLTLLTSAVLLVAAARAVRAPTLLAYLAVGTLLGPHGLAVFPGGESMAQLAEFGVVFLMFSIGLEFSLTRLRSMHRLVFGLGGAQMGLTMAAVVTVTVVYFQQDWRVGVAVGAACAMSSTAIVAKLLSERFEIHTPAGRQTMGVLLFQDLAVVPLLILVPALGAPAGDLLPTLGGALAVAVVVLVGVIRFGPRVMRGWFALVSARRSDELFMLGILWTVLVLAGATAWAGLSMALGAFLAGVLISETVYRHQVEADIRPFRDVLLGLFFVTVGMQLDLHYVIAHIGHVILALILLVLAKGGIVLAITLSIRNASEVALRTAAQLAQAGEFGFVLLELSGEARLIPADVFQVTMAAMLLSMFLAPLLIQRAARLSERMTKGRWANDAQALHAVAVHGMQVNGHVILCGFGRYGRGIADFLEREAIPFLALDLDPGHVDAATAAGRHVVFGNAERREVLTAAGLARARAVVVTYPELASAERVIRVVRAARADLPVLVRAEDDDDAGRLRAAGASEVIAEVIEGSLMMAVQTLTVLGVPGERAMAHAGEARLARQAAAEA